MQMTLLQTIHQLDVQTFYWFMARKHRVPLTRISRVVSFSADGPLYVFFIIGLWWVDQRLLVGAILLGFASERVLYWSLKNSFRRHRPADSLKGFVSVIRPSDQFSFPSGHTSGAFFMAYFLGQWWPEWQLTSYIWAIQVGLSRIFLGVHFPTDTIMGALLGTGCALVAAGLIL